jgi:putative MATE family efflux protein
VVTSNVPNGITKPRRDWTQGSLIGNLWSLSWPMTVSSSLSTLGPTVDMIWVGRLGAASIAGVGISGLAVMVITSLMSGLFTGTTAMVARFMGARDERNAILASQQAFVIGLVFSAFMAILGIFLAKPILVLLGVAPDVVAEGAAYMRIQLVGMVTMGALSIAQSIMQASGDAVIPMKISFGYRLLHATLCPFLVFGWWHFPRLEVSGAALSNVISQGIGGVVGLWILFSGGTRLTITLRNFRFNPDIIWRTIKIGVPASLSMMQINFSNFILVWFITPFGTLAVAAHSLSQRIDWIVQMLAAGFGTAAGVLAGQNLGAGQPERAARTTWLAVGLATLMTILCSLVIWFWAERILHIFNDEPQIVNVAAKFLRIQIAGYLVWGLVIALSMSLNGVGSTTVPMVTNLTTLWMVQISLAYFLPRYTGLGVYGVRWSIVIGLFIRAIIYPFYFLFGPWQHKKI